MTMVLLHRFDPFIDNWRDSPVCLCQHREVNHDPETAECALCEECPGFERA